MGAEDPSTPEVDQPPADPEAPTAKGQALRRTPAQLRKLSRISAADKAAGKAFWEEHAPARYKGLGSAEPEDE